MWASYKGHQYNDGWNDWENIKTNIFSKMDFGLERKTLDLESWRKKKTLFPKETEMDEHFGTTESLFAKMACSLAVNKLIILPYVDKRTNR